MKVKTSRTGFLTSWVAAGSHGSLSQNFGSVCHGGSGWLQGGPQLERITGVCSSGRRPVGTKVWEKFLQGRPTVRPVQTEVINLSCPQTLKSQSLKRKNKVGWQGGSVVE